VGRPGGWTIPGLSKDRPVQRLGQTWLTRRVNPWLGQDPMCFFCFFKYKIWNPSVYILYVPNKKVMFFEGGIKKNWFKYFNLERSHNIFLMWDLKSISIYILCSHEKSYFFSMWDLKPISIYTLCSQEKNYFFSMWDLKPIN
jgi:hypothetical protein